MKVVQICSGRFHHFNLARQLDHRGMLERFFTGYPFFMMRNEGLSREKVTNFPLLMTAYVALRRYGLLQKRAERPMNRWGHETLNAYVAANLPECDVVFALSSSGLRAGHPAQQQGDCL